MSLAVSSRSGVRRIPFSELQICGCCLHNGDEQLLSCAKCSVLVHAHCYEPDRELDPSTWICTPCSTLSPSVRDTITCGICAMPGGAMKPTDEDGWAHVCCAYWTPETYFSNKDIITGVADIPAMRRSLRCIFCKKNGGCVQCTVGKCCTPFHLVCACQHGLQLSINMNEDGSFVSTSICPKHKHLPRKLRNPPHSSVTKTREEDAICDVCGHDSDSENNDIVICDGCEVAVHQNCYGIRSIPETQWFCQSCSSDRPGKCILCADTEGALKQATNGDWVHVACALWSHQAVFSRPSSLDGVVGLDRLLLDDPDRQCQYCRDPVGFCCDCASPDCNLFYHVRCARRDKCRVEMYDLKNPSSSPSTLPLLSSPNSQSELAFVVYCKAHSALPFSADVYQRDHPFPLLENGVLSDHESNSVVNHPAKTASKKRNRRFKSMKTTVTNAAVDDRKRSQADVFWQDEVQPYFEPPRLSALRLSMDFCFTSDFSLMLSPLAKTRSLSVAPSWPSYKHCDWVCDQLAIHCEKSRRLYALLVLNENAVFTNFYEGAIINFCFVETSNFDCELSQELTKCQKSLASQIRELDIFRKRIRARLDESPPSHSLIQRDKEALHKDYVDMSHSQVVRLSLVAGFRDLDLAASDFTQEHFNTTCRICFGTEGTEVNPIVICEHCGLAVHKYCYGIQVIPEDDWLCNSCAGIISSPADFECALCTLDGFASKSSDLEGQNVHLVCALWCPKVRISDMVKMEPVVDLQSALSGDRFECAICHQDRGFTVACKHPVCSQRYHVTCAWEFGLFMEVNSSNGKPDFNCFCVEHTPAKAGGPERDRLKQHELRLKARTQKPTPPVSAFPSPVVKQNTEILPLAVPRALDGEDLYLPDVCAVCFSSTPDTLCKCVSCAIAVHRDCYHIDASVTDFRCIRCSAQPQRARKVSCAYCPRLGGAYDRHETSRWRHKACEHWTNVFRSHGERLYANSLCAVCDRREGSCISCTALGCTTKFHALCGLFVGCEMRHDDNSFVALCPLHTPIHIERNPIKDGIPDLFVFFDRLRLVRADMDELRTILDLVKRRERLKKGLLSLRFDIDSEFGVVQAAQIRINEDEYREAELQERDHLRLVQSLQSAMEGVREESELEDGEVLEDGEIPEDEQFTRCTGESIQIVSEPEHAKVRSDTNSMDIVDDYPAGPVDHTPSSNVPVLADGFPLSPRRLDFGLSEPLVDNIEARREEIESLHLTDSESTNLVQTATKDVATDAAAEPIAADNHVESNEESPDGDATDNHGSQGSPDDYGDDESSEDDHGRDRKDGGDDRPRRGGRKTASSSDDEESEESDNDDESKPLVSVHEHKVGRSATRFRIKIDRAQLPILNKIKIKKSLLKSSVVETQSEHPQQSRGRRRLSEPLPVSDEHDESESDSEQSGRRRRRRSLRYQPGSDTEDFASDHKSGSRRHTPRTAALADRQPKDSGDVNEFSGNRWHQEELDYLREIISNGDTNPDWSVVVQMLEDRFGATYRIYSRSAVQSRWARITGVYSRKQSPAPVVEPHSQRTRWPPEELEYLRSLVANNNEEGKRNWPDIVKQMRKKFGNQYRDYSVQILQSKVHRLLNAPEPVERKVSEPVRKAAVKPSSKSKWHNEELEYLRGLVNKFGTDDWMTIANMMDKFLGERHRIYTGPILQKKWRDIGPRGQAGPAVDIDDDIVANPVHQQTSNVHSDDDEVAESDVDQNASEEDREEALSKRESGAESGHDSDAEEVVVQKSPIITEPIGEAAIESPAIEPVVGHNFSESNQRSEEEDKPASPSIEFKDDHLGVDQDTTASAKDDSERTLSLQKSVSSESGTNAMNEMDTQPTSKQEAAPADIDAALPQSEQQQEDTMAVDAEADIVPSPAQESVPAHTGASSEPKAISEPEKTAMDVDVAESGSVELRSPVAQPATSVTPAIPSETHPSISQPESAPSAKAAADECFEEVPWRLEPDDDNELLRAPIHQAPIVFPQSASDSLFQSSVPAFVMNQGNEIQAKPKGNAWRDEEIKYLNELGGDPNLRKDWDLIAEKMSDKFGTLYRAKYQASSIKQRWSKAHPQKTRTPGVAQPATAATKEPRRPPAAKELRRHQPPPESSTEAPAPSKEDQEGVTRTPYQNEELDYLNELVEQFGSKDWQRVAQRMQFRFRDKYRRYAPMSLSMKWTRLRAKNEATHQPSETAPSAADLPESSTAETPVSNPVAEEKESEIVATPAASERPADEVDAKSELENEAQESIGRQLEREPEPVGESDQAQEPCISEPTLTIPEPDQVEQPLVPVADQGSSLPADQPIIGEGSKPPVTTVVENVSQLELAADQSKTGVIESMEQASSKGQPDEEVGSKDSRRSRRSRTEAHPEIILTSRTRAGRSPVRQPMASEKVSPTAEEPEENAKEGTVANLPLPTRSRSQQSVAAAQTEKRPARASGRKAAKVPEECHSHEGEPEVSHPAPPPRARTPSVKAPWLDDELEYLRSACESTDNDYKKVAEMMTEKFGSTRRPNGYTHLSVMTAYRRSAKRPRSAQGDEPPLSPRRSRSRAASPALKTQVTRSPSSKPARSVGSPVADSGDVTSPAPTRGRSRRRSPGHSEPSPKRPYLGIEPADSTTKANTDGAPASQPVPRRRRRSEAPPFTTPKRRKTAVPETEPRKPKAARIPNQGINRLERLIQNLQEHDFKADERTKVLRFLRAHQNKWRHQRALEPSDKAFVLDSWQFKPYEVKIVQVLDDGQRYRIHYLNWSSKFDEDLPGEFVFRDSAEIRLIREMANTYSKTR